MITLFLKRSPFIRIVFPFIIGIYIGHNLEVPLFYLALLIIVFLVGYLVFVQWMKGKVLYGYRHLSGVLSFTILILIGILYLQLRRPLIIDSNDKVTAKIEVIDHIGQTKTNDKFEVYLRSTVDSLSRYQNLKGIVYLPIDTSGIRPAIGDNIVINGRFIPFTEPEHPFTFDYSNYLKNHRIAFRIMGHYYAEAANVIPRVNLMIWVAQVKKYLLDTFVAHGMSGKDLAILNALYLGDKSKLSYEQKDAFADAGAMHLLAVSGLHVGIIYLLLLNLVGLFGLKKGSAVVAFLVIAVLWLYALVTGFSASVLRASIMFTILEIGRLSRLKTGVFNLLGASMFIILIIEPLSVFNIGFWLSHCAVASIVSFYPKINKCLYFKFPPFRWLWSIVAVSIAAQIGTVPISLYAFHEFPLYFLASNILLIPIVSPLLIMAVLASVFSFSTTVLELIVPALGEGIAYMEVVAMVINGLPNATLTNLYLPWWQLIFIYLSLVLLLIYLDYRHLKYLMSFLISLVVLIATFYVVDMQQVDQAIIVANVKNKSVVNYIGPNVNEIYTSSPVSDKEIAFVFKGLWAYCGARSQYTIVLMDEQSDMKPVIKQLDGLNVLIIPPNVTWHKQLDSTVVDKLIVMNYSRMSLEKMANTMRIDELILPNGWKFYQKKKWAATHGKHVNSLHDVYKDGVVFVGL